jgi:hypothetical protein
MIEVTVRYSTDIILSLLGNKRKERYSPKGFPKEGVGFEPTKVVYYTIFNQMYLFTTAPI